MSIFGFPGQHCYVDMPTSNVPRVIRKYEEVIGCSWTQTHTHIELEHPALHIQRWHKHFHLSHQRPQDHVALDPLYLRWHGNGDKKTTLILSLLRQMKQKLDLQNFKQRSSK